MKHIDIVAHICLLFGLVVGTVAIFRLRYDNVAQFLVILILAAFYLLWGIVYHNLKRDLDRKLLFEYLLIAAIVVVVGLLVFVG